MCLFWNKPKEQNMGQLKMSPFGKQHYIQTDEAIYKEKKKIHVGLILLSQYKIYHYLCVVSASFSKSISPTEFLKNVLHGI